MRDAYHEDWRGELFGLGLDAVIVSGYGWRTHREVIWECVRQGIPVAMWSDSNLRGERGGGLKRIKRALKKRFLHGMVRSVDLLLTANRLGVAYWRYYGAAPSKIELCPCYSDYARIDAARARGRGEVLGRIGLQERDRVLFSAARLAPEKGLDLMIRAFKQLRLGEQGWRYVVAGVGPLEGELKALAGEALGKSILFVGFQQPTDNLALMAQAEMLALPSRYEPHGIVVPEALAAGTPVLASDVVGAAPDLVTHGQNGLIFRAGDAGDLAAKVKAVVEEGSLEAMQAAARPAFEAWYRRTSPIRVVPAAVRRMLAGRAKRGENRRA